MARIQIHDSGSTVLVRGVFEDFSEFQKLVPGWEVDFRQLDRGPSPVEATQVMSGQAQLLRFRFERRYEQRGSPPAGTLNFGIPEDSVEPRRWRGNGVGDSSLICFAPGGELSSVSRAGFSGMTLSVDPDHLARIADALGLPEAVVGLDIPHLLAGIDPEVVGRLRQAADRLIVVATDHRKGVPASTAAPMLDDELPTLLVEAIASAHAPVHTSGPSPRARTRALRRATAYIDAHANEAPTIRRICKASGVSWRTLDYAFKEHFSVTPKEYLQTVRLHGVRRELQISGGEALIADVANRWGFWHMGQFAADYRVKFGELPSVIMGHRARV